MGPAGQQGLPVSETKTEPMALSKLARPRLVDGEFSGETTDTIVTYYSRRVGWLRW